MEDRVRAVGVIVDYPTAIALFATAFGVFIAILTPYRIVAGTV
jgi:hypothetical protein